GGTATLGRLRPAAHRRCRVAGAGRQRAAVAPAVHPRLWRDLRRRPLLHRQDDPARRGRPHAGAGADGAAPADGGGGLRGLTMQGYLPIILPLAWAVVIAFGIFVYVLLDGFDLGLGMLFLAAPSDAARDNMMRSVAPVWDGNETWLVLGGTALLAA